MSFVNGIASLLGAIDKRIKRAPEAAAEAIEAEAYDLLHRSQAECPVDTGHLVSTGFVDIERTSTGAVGTIGYTADYALAVHENTAAEHPNGGKAKFLTDPLNASSDKLQRALATHLEGGK